ncbi:isoleucine--tRNA ligase [Candidatus Woesearchaeota archaeon]|nr:isoleucine--tRNA ligase [Candidatus Woesearchaeota archaeon]
MKYLNYNHAEIEPQILAYWQENRIIESSRKRNKKGKKFYFLQGPPYTSGKLHLGHAWNHALKDIVLRYKRMQGFNVWDRNGYDMHGLPTERKVMEKFNLKFKEDIEKFGIEKFAQECLQWSTEKAKVMDQDLQRLGITLDYTDPYLPVTNEYMEGCWWLVKQAHKQKRLYLGERTISWCANCETAIAKHECEYKNITENSIFVKFPLKNKRNEYFVIWTTTPWTIAFNLAIMVNPELDYVKAEVYDQDGKNKQIWYLAKALAGVVIQAVADKKFTIKEEFKGEKLNRLEYNHPWTKYIPAFSELKKKHPNVHTILLSEEYVDTSAGSGLVHCAPGCGPEDYEIGHANNIPPFNNINEKGIFPQEMSIFAGKKAKQDDLFFIEQLKKDEALIETTPVEHDYAHCQRCQQPVIFRITPQWFFKIEDLKQKMSKANQKIYWNPKTAKNGFASWLSNLRDNSITKQRFWGTPLPIWTCNHCKEFKVFGSKAELEKHAKNVPENLHKPWIDHVKFPCKKCKGTMFRIPDVLDVWIDAGCASWNCLYYPQRKDLFEQFYPADFILEGKDQIRGWFNLLMIASIIAFNKPAFEKVYMHGFVTDVSGVKMSKSLGNITSPYEVIDKYGSDGLRYYMCQNTAGEDINFSWDEANTKSRYLHILWNIHKLLLNLANETKMNPFQSKKEIMNSLANVEEKYIFSRLNSTIKEVNNLLEEYRIDEIIKPLENLYLELSRTYIQMVREKSSLGEEQEKELVMYTITAVLLNQLKMFGIVAPFVCEAIFLNLKEQFNLKEESISHFAWPKVNAKFIDEKLEQNMDTAQAVIQSALNAREKSKLGLRWPVKELIVVTKNKETAQSIIALNDIIKNQANVKNIRIVEKLPEIKHKIKPNYGKIGPVYGELSAEIITELTINSPETILSHIEEENFYAFKLRGKDIKITKEMIILESAVPEKYKEAETKNGFLYLDIERTAELEAEGYAREIMRNIQQARKNANLQKLDHINLFIKTTEPMKKSLAPFQEDIAEKVGAKNMDIASINMIKTYHHQSEFTIKTEKFFIGFDKI